MTEPEHPVQRDSAAPEAAEIPYQSSFFNEIRGWARDVLFAIGGAVVIVVFFYQPVKVEGTSMLPELVDQERIFVNKFLYRIDSIERGDIVVFWYPLDRSKSYIKRVIGVPGDVIEVREGSVLVNGEPLDEVYVPSDFMDWRSYPALTIDDGHYYVLGDHRNQSNDSRMWGLVPRDNIYGKAVFRYWPVSKMGAID
jgi:signal peptidase I